VGVVLSGNGSDALIALQAIKAVGGVTFAQDELSARYPSMPRSAALDGNVDHVMRPRDIARELEQIALHPYTRQTETPPVEPVVAEADDVAEIISLLRNRTAVDFTNYKQTTIRRRIQRRMALRNLHHPREYLTLLRENDVEVQNLYQDFLIRVSQFFRDPEAFEALKEKVFPAVVNGWPAGSVVRVGERGRVGRPVRRGRRPQPDLLALADRGGRADRLFRSAARYYGRRVVGVILSGALHDGTAGVMALRAAGGLAVVQDPGEAFVAGMPQSAAQIAGADHIVPVAEMAPLLTALVQEGSSMSGEASPKDPIERMPGLVDEDMEEQAQDARRGDVSVFTCPECGGALWQVDDDRLLRFRCHVGHAYNAEVLFQEQSEALEAALWTAVRTFREKSVLARQLANRERAEGNVKAAQRFDEQAGQADHQGRLIQRYLLNGDDTGLRAESASVPSRPQ